MNEYAFSPTNINTIFFVLFSSCDYNISNLVLNHLLLHQVSTEVFLPCFCTVFDSTYWYHTTTGSWQHTNGCSHMIKNTSAETWRSLWCWSKRSETCQVYCKNYNRYSGYIRQWAVCIYSTIQHDVNEYETSLPDFLSKPDKVSSELMNWCMHTPQKYKYSVATKHQTWARSDQFKFS